MELGAWLETQINPLAEALDKAMRKGLQEYEKLRVEGKKGALSHIYISLLRTGVLFKTPWFRFDLQDENGLKDMIECSVMWDVPAVSDRLYYDVDALANQREGTQDYELEKKWLDAAEEYHEALAQVLPKVLERCLGAYTGCQWHFRAIPMGSGDGKDRQYFRLEQDSRMPYGVLLPNQGGIPGYESARKGDLSNLPNATAFFVPSSPVNFYPDILDRQIFMVKGVVKEAFDIFMPELEYKHCCLMDKLNDRLEIYYIPLLRLAEPQKEIMREHDIFRIMSKRGIEVSVSLEVIEAILRRKPTGVTVSRIE